MNFYTSHEIKDWYQQEAKRRGMSESGLLSHVLYEYMNKQKTIDSMDRMKNMGSMEEMKEMVEQLNQLSKQVGDDHE